MRRGRKSIALFKVLFTGLLLLPTVCMLLGGGTLFENSEKREMAEFPSISDSVAQFPKAYEAWFNDHFWGRNELVFAASVLKTGVLQTSPEDDVLIGRDGWRFLNKRHMIDDYRGVAPLSNDELVTIQRKLELMDSVVKTYGGKLVVVVVPNKQSVYPEHLPWRIQKLNDTTRLTQLDAYISQHSDITFLNLLPTMLEGKADRKVYFTTDTHWTHPGAFLAYREIMKKMLEMEIQTQVMDEPEYVHSRTTGDLNGMLGFAGFFQEETELWEIPKHITFAFEDFASAGSLEIVTNKKGTGKLMFIRDSFGMNIRGYLYNSFGRTLFVKNNKINLKLIAEEQPDVVLFEIVERKLPFFVNCKVEY